MLLEALGVFGLGVIFFGSIWCIYNSFQMKNSDKRSFSLDRFFNDENNQGPYEELLNGIVGLLVFVALICVYFFPDLELW